GRSAGNTGERRTMSSLPPCPACGSDLTYEDGTLLVCPECAHEWAPGDATGGGETRVHRDAVGNILADGDSVTVVKDLKVKGAGSALKAGTKVRNRSEERRVGKECRCRRASEH